MKLLSWHRSVAQTLIIFISGFLAFAPLSACGGGGGSTVTPPPPPPPPPPAQISKAFKTAESTSSFLAKATFGATKAQIDSLKGTAVSDWLLGQFNHSPTLYLDRVLALLRALPRDEMLFGDSLTNMYIDDAIASDDQLRLRMVLALSEIIVTSLNSDLDNYPDAMAYYVDILSRNAFGNYRDILKEITYSPAMGFYLTYLANEKGDPDSGRMPDENYARELLQLFTIGLNELNMDGTEKTDAQGKPIEIYDNTDITGLAKVFTGLSTQNSDFYDVLNDESSVHKPMVAYADFHSELEKTFLGKTIPAGTSADESIEQALDIIFNHPNVAPFISKQLIQRFVTSNPKPAYVQRVANVFESGTYKLPNGTTVGAGKRGDLKATIAAILLDDEALQTRAEQPDDFGKIREPFIRFVNWARAFKETDPDTADEYFLEDASFGLAQHPFRSRSVFNFFRPGYVAPGTETGAAGLVAPELQITNESSVINYINYMNAFIYNFSPTISEDPDNGVNADYSDVLALADDADKLVDYLNLVLAAGNLTATTKSRIKLLLAEVPISTGAPDEDKLSRVFLAVTMVMSAPGYIVQR
ncbi:MAG TPA: DUF1800 domain-containing protein [Hellea balneolensis]|uniref:DUF1800 domain-containing protein n=1 Tax=Hellea balneolensis TaxID=287478 RepID=A0A7C5QQ67_9PROT|nr:DUF1800 domain-containing protein [Hellea balneolensis]